MNRITELFGIEYPIVQGGMVWCSGWRLAAAVSNAGGLGLLGAGSMHPETLQEHIGKMKTATDKPWGINIPLMYPEIDRLMKIVTDSGVRVVFTSAGSPKRFTPLLHEAGITVAHVVSSSTFARKCEEAGVDAVVAEGFEAGGHNGREETTTLALIPQVRRATHCSRRHRQRQGYDGGTGTWRRRCTDRNAIRLIVRKLGIRSIQTALSVAQRGRNHAVSEKARSHPTCKEQPVRTYCRG